MCSFLQNSRAHKVELPIEFFSPSLPFFLMLLYVTVKVKAGWHLGENSIVVKPIVFVIMEKSFPDLISHEAQFFNERDCIFGWNK